MKTNLVSKFVLATAVVFFAGALATSSADAGKKASYAKGENVTASFGNSHIGGVGVSASKSTAASIGKGKGSDATAGGGYIAGGGGSFFGGSYGFAGGVSHTSASSH